MAKDTTFNPDTTSVKNAAAYRKEQEAQKQAEEQELTMKNRFSNFFGNGRTRIAISVLLMFAAVFMLVAFVSFCFGTGNADQSATAAHSVVENAKAGGIKNIMGSLGASLSNTLVYEGFGLAAFVLVVWCFVLAGRFWKKERKVFFFSFSLVCLFTLFAMSLVLAACTSMLSTPFPLGGVFGQETCKFLVGLMGVYGMIGVVVVAAIFWVLLTYNTLSRVAKAVKSKIPQRRDFNGEKIETGDNKPVQSGFLGDNHDSAKSSPVAPSPAPKPRVVPQRVPKPRNLAPGGNSKTGNLFDPVDGDTYKDPTGEYIHYHFPSLDLLSPVKMGVSVDQQDIEANKKRIEETLLNYNIPIKQIDAHVGPTVTLFEIVPQEGVKIATIRSREEDIALSLKALGVRIIAPMPGRGTVGIEVPNHDPQVVPIRRAFEDPKFQNTKCKLPMAVGITVSNEVFVSDLTKMPHLLVAGATGKGKSVGLNAIITSLLYKKGPSDLKLILVDPKRVEFSVYADLEKYYFARVPGEEKCIVTDTSKVVKTLNCLVQEMENRYKALEEVKVRKLEDYNMKWREGLRDVLDADGNKKYKYFPYIVCVIDEFSDMIMTAGKEVETPIVRIAQKARAVGIHLIVATQRPDAKVITGNIKVNIPGRMAFAVSQMQDSRTIIDRSGAQNLIGRGDMLFSIDGDITRLQCPFIDTDEIIRICDYIKEQEEADLDVNHEEPYELPEYIAPVEDGDGADFNGAGSNLNDRDSLFEECAKWVVTGDVASTSSLQRRYGIGYNRAGRIMDQLEAAGIVGPSTGGKPRRVLMSPMDVDQMIATSFHK